MIDQSHRGRKYFVTIMLSSAILCGGLTGCVATLAEAISKGDVETVRRLLDKGAGVNELEDGYTPLKLAFDRCQVRIAQLLLDRGAEIDKTWGSLQIAVNHAGNIMAGHSLGDSNDCVAIVQLMLDRGLDINFKNKSGYTALHAAASWGDKKMAQFLLERGAKCCEEGNEGYTPLDFARKRGHAAVVRLLEQAEARQSGTAQSGASSSLAATATPSTVASLFASDVDRLPAIKVSPKKNAYAVVIGIESYREKLPKADFADRDATLVGQYLTKVLGYPEENVVVRINDKAARTDLEKYLEGWLPNNVEKDSSVFVYYSGHGAPNPKTGDAYLVPYDGDPTFVEKTAYPLKRLYATLSKLSAKEITVVLDSCFSGAGGRSVLAEGARPMTLSIENPLLASGKTVILAASSGDQVSSTFKDKGHGLLTYYFLKGLQGEGDTNKDGVIEIAELYEYVKPNVQRVARKQYNNEQTPQLLASPEVFRKGGGRLLEHSP